jgi:SWI/SNF-related matrix-associated actin-dependent regulator 1 of chromatin subfamily A
MTIYDLARAEADYLTAKAAHLAARAAVATAFGTFAEADAAGDASANELYRAWSEAALALQTAHDGHHKAAANARAAADAAEAKDQAAVAAADAALAANANYAADAPKADWEAVGAAHDAALDAALEAEDAQLAADAASELYRTAHADAAASAYALRTGRISWVVQNEKP